MKKKLFKYIKFFVSVALILSLVAPSYASLGASDGSAFVTKAEFDSALADFNSRLTTFEAGINSKIDSQVTSYLDRNGIWSGKAQTMEPQTDWPNKIYTWDMYDQLVKVGDGTLIYGDTEGGWTSDVTYCKMTSSGMTMSGPQPMIQSGWLYTIDATTGRYVISRDPEAQLSYWKGVALTEPGPKVNKRVVNQINKNGLCVLDLTYAMLAYNYTGSQGTSLANSFFVYNNNSLTGSWYASSAWYQFKKDIFGDGVTAGGVPSRNLINYSTVPNNNGWQAVYYFSNYQASTSNWTLPYVQWDLNILENGYQKEGIQLYYWAPPRQGHTVVLNNTDDERSWLSPSNFAKEPTRVVKTFFVEKGHTLDLSTNLVFGGRGINFWAILINAGFRDSAVDRGSFAGLGLQVNSLDVY